ncbi:MAG: hypothetical protein QNJ14_13570 [Woeseiaceae bacterium]|nr:hypothetical protein [Woeseiaceae bacterium]
MSSKDSLKHRIGRAIFAGVVGLVTMVIAFNWISDPTRRAQRDVEEQAVLAARELLVEVVGVDTLEIVDPLSPDRAVGKGYIYAQEPGWAVSGYYRRNESDRWRPYLLVITDDHRLHDFKAEDGALK